MIKAVKFSAAEYKPNSDFRDARNVTKPMKLRIVLDRRGIADLMQALASCIDGAAAAYCPAHDGNIEVDMGIWRDDEIEDD